jgi:phosphatidate cytidylyltransferase
VSPGSRQRLRATDAAVLVQRILTAVVLLAVLLPAMASSRSEPFAALTLAFIVAAGWEWARLNGWTGWLAGCLAGLLLVLGALAWGAGWTASVPSGVWMAASLAWLAGGAWSLRAGVQGWSHHARAARLLAGVLCLAVAWLGIVNARHIGLNFLLSVLCLVWVADIAAYFGGHLFGRRKLAPRISPGKTWEGAFSGLIGVCALAVVWSLVIDRHLPVDGPSLYTRLAALGGGVGLAAVLCAGLTALSVVGDLFESLVKRAAGVKDSSGLLPGHGGVLDRVDALLPVFPAALALVASSGGAG